MTLTMSLSLTCCQGHILTENIWFVWSETSYSGDERRCYRCGTNERTNIEDRENQPMEAGYWVSQLHVGVLNGKYDLAGSEFKIWPKLWSGCGSFGEEKPSSIFDFFSTNLAPDHNLGQILNSDPARSYIPPEFSEILLKSIIVIQYSTDPVNRERGI